MGLVLPEQSRFRPWITFMYAGPEQAVSRWSGKYTMTIYFNCTRLNKLYKNTGTGSMIYYDINHSFTKLNKIENNIIIRNHQNFPKTRSLSPVQDLSKSCSSIEYTLYPGCSIRSTIQQVAESSASKYSWR